MYTYDTLTTATANTTDFRFSWCKVNGLMIYFQSLKLV